MSLLHLTLESLITKPTILISGCNTQLEEELIFQMTALHDVNTQYVQNGLPDNLSSNLSVIIHLVGFGRPILAQTLSATETLHQLLQLAYKHNSKFILVLGSPNSHLCNTSISLLIQFVKTYKLHYEILDWHPSFSNLDFSEQIIKKFIHNFSRIDRPVSIKIAATVLPSQTKTSLIKFKNIFCYFVLVFFTPFTFMVLLTWLYTTSVTSSLKSLINTNFLTQTHQLSLANVLNSPIHIFSKFNTSLTAYEVTLDQLNTISNLYEKINLTKPYSAEAWLNPILTKDLEYLENNLQNNYQKLSLLREENTLLIKELNLQRLLLSKINLLAPIYKNLFGYTSPVTYLIVTQDITTLTPSGGSLKNFALLNIKNGQDSYYQSYNQDNLNKLLVGKVEPAADIKRLLNVSSWPLDQSNWDPDISKSAAKIAWFTTKATGQFPDVVIIINALDLEKFVNSFTLNSKSDLVNLLKLFESRQAFVVPITERFSNLKNLNWSGELGLKPCASPNPCQQDYIYSLDSSLVNQISITDLTRLTEIQYRLTSQKTTTLVRYALNKSISAPKNMKAKIYHRLFIPEKAKITSAKINGKSVLLGLFPVSSSQGLTCWGFVLDLENDVSALLELEYDQEIITNKSLFHFEVNLLNQPGLSTGPVYLEITYPKTWLATTTNQPAVATPGTLRYNTQSQLSQKIDIDFLKK